MSGNYNLYGQVSNNDFEILKQEYAAENAAYEKKMIFHVGSGAGLFSELGAMLECMCYCHANGIAFSLYADDANFAGQNGWTELFEPFCEMKHHPDNKKYNYRYKNYHRVKGIAVPNMLFRRYLFPDHLKRVEHVDYLTQDLFDDIVSAKFRYSKISWPLFGIGGVVRDEYAKLTPLALRYNAETAKEIANLVDSLNLPEHFASIQIRGGDKVQEFTDIIDAEFCTKLIEEKIKGTNNIFVFTDDYRNVEYIKKTHQEWSVFALTRPDECGYYNAKFNALPWAERRQDIIKLLAIVEICIRSDHHIGCDGACVNNYIRSCRIGRKYDEYTIGKRRTKTGLDKIKRIIGI